MVHTSTRLPSTRLVYLQLHFPNQATHRKGRNSLQQHSKSEQKERERERKERERERDEEGKNEVKHSVNNIQDTLPAIVIYYGADTCRIPTIYYFCR